MAKRHGKSSDIRAAEGIDPSAAQPTIRVDLWLFYARFFKTRHLAAKVITKGRLRLNGQRSAKPGHVIRPGDELTFPMGDAVRLIRVLATGTRRGSATEAQTLYLDLAPPALLGSASALE